QAGVYAGGPLVQDVLGLSVYAETRGRGETPDAADPRLSELERRAAQTGSATLTWTPDPRQRIDLTLGYGTEEHERNTLQTGTVPYYYTSTDEVERRQFALSHRGDWDWGTSELRAYRTQLDRENIRTQGTPTGPQKLTDDIVDGHVSVPVLGWNTFTFGGEWRREQLEDPTVNSLGSDEANHQAVFLQDQIALSDNLSLLLGSRADRHEEFGWNHSPRAYLVYHLSDALTLKGGVGRGFKAPTLKQLSPGYSASAAGGRFTIVGNPDLNPEINTMYEIGAEYETRGWSLRGSLFQNDLKDLIQTTCIASCGVPRVERRTYGNVERARIRGVELGGGLDLTSWLRFDANYTYLNTENRGTGAELTERPRHAANASLTLFAENGLRARLLSEYVGKQLVNVTSGTEQLPDYAIWSFDIAQPLTDKATLLIGMQNLTDERLAEKTASFPYAEAGRTLWFGLNYSF
ncbi:MAG: TonB-dependent receptor domain-containing protein, partial [Oceanibaculum sp.]